MAESAHNSTPSDDFGVVNVSSEMPLDYAIPLYGYCMPVLLVVTVISNGIIVIVLSQKHMRTPTNMVLLAMAICDLCTLAFPAPWLIYMYTLGYHQVPMEDTTTCYLWSVFHEVSGGGRYMVLWSGFGVNGKMHSFELRDDFAVLGDVGEKCLADRDCIGVDIDDNDYHRS